MQCLFCNEKIGLMRAAHDREFCCDDHRRRGKAAHSARSMRDDEDSGYYEAWLPEASLTQKKKAGFSPGLGVALVVLAAGAILFMPRRGDEARPGRGERAAAGSGYTAPAAGLRDSVARAFSGGRSSAVLRQDFKLDLGNWQSNWSPKFEMASSDWQQVGKAVRVGSLRLWKPTTQMANYNVNFGAQIDNKAVSWAVRAADHSNYYATKLSLQDQGRGAPKAEIVRYAMVNGKAATKIEMPIPVTLERGKLYDIAMRVSGNKYVTSIDGQVVASWSDDQMKRGGVGFFSEPGERATLHYVNVNERESFMQRFLSFSFLVGPWDMPGIE